VSDDDLKPVLHSGEKVVAQGPADLSVPPLPMPDSPPALLGGLLVRAWRSLRPEDPVEAASLIEDSRDTAFPLDRHMVLVLTSERILTWSSRTRRVRSDTLLADVPLWQIQSITSDYLPPGPRKDIRITMQDGLSVDIRLPTHLADLLRNQFRRRH
jgi:hypothetical protein